MRRSIRGAFAGGLSLWLLGCGDATGGGSDTAACVGAKCDALDDGSSGGESSSTGDADTPVSELDQTCWEREAEASNPNRRSFTTDALRWSCSDVDSTAAADRGQEYCEYFAIATLPPTPSHPELAPQVLGRLLGPDGVDGLTPIPLELDGEQVAALEGSPDSVVAACVFTSWDADLEAPCGDACEVDPILGVPFDTETFRMKFDPNTQEAAVNLVSDCGEFLPTAGDPNDPDDPYHDPFFRACHLNAEINETQYRKSDNVICTASVRMAECGCHTADGSALGEHLAPADELGFRLGTWSGIDALPAGCRWHDVVDGAHTLVVCDLTAAEVLQNADELKGYCRSRYADDVVVHVEVPVDAIVCEPPAGEAYADDCPAHPWVLEP